MVIVVYFFVLRDTTLQKFAFEEAAVESRFFRTPKGKKNSACEMDGLEKLTEKYCVRFSKKKELQFQNFNYITYATKATRDKQNMHFLFVFYKFAFVN